MNNRDADNKRAIEAKSDSQVRESFLSEEQEHILRLTARIMKRTVTHSDDEFSLALIAVSDAIDTYDENKGPFWNYASLVIKSRIIDYLRKNYHNNNEMLVAPESFSGEIKDDDESSLIGITYEIKSKTAVYVDNSLKHEIEALTEELSSYGIDIFDLPKAVPKTAKTKESCNKLITAFFLPPPLMELLRKTGNLPIKELLERCPVSRKLVERHRKYLMASVLVKGGDYTNIGDYLS